MVLHMIKSLHCNFHGDRQGLDRLFHVRVIVNVGFKRSAHHISNPIFLIGQQLMEHVGCTSLKMERIIRFLQHLLTLVNLERQLLY